MYALFEETGRLLAGRIIASADAASQIELESGKRLKVKSPMVFLQFSQPEPAQFFAKAEACASEMELNLAWEFAPEGEFGFADLAKEYFSNNPSPEQLAASLMCLHGAPHYFRRAGKGRFKKADAHTVQLALAGIEKRKELEAQIARWSEALCAGECPDNIKAQIYKILFKPDKNTAEYKAVAMAAKLSKRPVLELLQSANAIASAYAFHWQRFLFTHFPKGPGFGDATHLSQLAPERFDPESLPLAEVKAFSIDDSSTTEIDDALSLQGLGTGRVRLGVHIAAPALGLLRGSAMDTLARERLSTVYMPGAKITMLPPDWVSSFSLDEGKHCPALSFYADFDEESLECLETQTLLERVWIEKNLRHDVLDAEVNEESLATLAQRSDIAFAPELAFLHHLASHLKTKREAVRGKPEVFSRPDYNFKIQRLNEGNEVPGELTGDLSLERVEITTRKRGSPLDLIVAEAMVFVNSSWGQWLSALGVPGIYRSQASMAPGIKVRMGLRALPHAGMGVAAYAWCSSPLRRYVDLLNQQQLIACVQNGAAAALAAPYKPKDADLFAIVGQFDETYRSYNQFQQSMERYWTLRFLEQEKIESLTATHLRDGLCRADSLPLVVQVVGAQNLARGAQLVLRIQSVDLMALEAHASIVQVLEHSTPEGSQPEEGEESDADEASLQVSTSLELEMETDTDTDTQAKSTSEAPASKSEPNAEGAETNAEESPA